MRSTRNAVAFLIAIVSLCDAGLVLGQQDRLISITENPSTSAIIRVTARLDGKGTVRTDESQTVAMRLAAEFDYQERVIARRDLLKSVRDYQRARAEIRLGTGSVLNELDEQRRTIIVQTRGNDNPVRYAAVSGPLTQQESELISIPANSLVLPQLVARENVRIGESWEPDRSDLARFLNIELVTESDVTVRLESVENGIATLFVGGQAKGFIDDSETTIDLSGSLRFDTSAGRVASVTLTLNQERGLGRISPGLDATFKLAARFDPVTGASPLSNDGLAQLREQVGRITDKLVVYPLNRTVRLMHSRNWKLIASQPERTILRYIDNGEMLGQCDIISLPKRNGDQAQTLEQFRTVVEEKLEDRHATVTGTDQATTQEGLQWMKVTAVGVAEGVRLVWTYYTITHEDGRRVQLVFTTEPEQSHRFEPRFAELIDSIVFPKSAVPASNAGHAPR